MPVKLFDAEGKEVEAFTKEEIELQKKGAIDAYLKDHPDQSDVLKKAQEDLKKATDLIAAGGASEEQKKRLIQEKKDAENTVSALTDKFMGEIKSLKDSIFSGTKSKILDRLSKNDPEVRKKIEHEMSFFAGDPKDEADLEARAVKAATIVTGSKPTPGLMDNAASGGGRGSGAAPAGNAAETDNSKAMRKAFGISDKDAEKFTPKN